MKRRIQHDVGPVDLRFVLIRCNDGAVIDGRECPQGILTRSHWQLVDTPNVVNTVCACPKDAPSPAATGEGQDQALGLLSASAAAS